MQEQFNTARPGRVWRAGALAAALALVAVGAPAQARVALSEEPFINQSLLAAAIGKAIVENCARIQPKYFELWLRGRELVDYAEGLGYSEDEIRAFVDSRTDRQRLRAEAAAYLEANGVVAGDEASYCALGHAEIENNTMTGQLMRSLD